MTTATEPRYYADPAIGAVRDRENLSIACGFGRRFLGSSADSLEDIAADFNTGDDYPALYHSTVLRELI
jgi:hypothetical protein